MAAGPPDPKIKPRLQEALDKYAPALAQTAQANPVIRANVLMPAARYGIREEMKQRYGFAWRDHVRGITTTFDAVSNLAFGETARQRLAEIDAKYADKIDAGFTLDPAKITDETAEPRRHRRRRQRHRRDRPLFRAGRDRVLLRLALRARDGDRLLRQRARKPHGRLDRQDHRRHRHRQHAARYAPVALSRHQGARAGSRRRAPKARSITVGGPSSPSPARSTIR